MSESQSSVPWVECPSIEVNLDRPMAVRIAEVPDEAIDRGRELLNAVLAEIPASARVLADAARIRTANRFHTEIAAMARRIGISWRSIMLANISYDLALSQLGCSTVVVPTADGPVVARNLDWWPEDILARTSCLVRYCRRGRLAFANAGWVGSTGVVTGLSSRGFAIVLNAVLSPERINKTGYPVLLHIRRVLEDARDFDDAVERLSEQPLIAPALFTVAGTDNAQRVVVERSPRRAALRWAEESQVLVATNDYRCLFPPETHESGEIYETTCMRFEALTRFFEARDRERPVTDAELLTLLSSPEVIQGITAQHIVIRPRSGEIRLFVPRTHLEQAMTANPADVGPCGKTGGGETLRSTS